MKLEDPPPEASRSVVVTGLACFTSCRSRVVPEHLQVDRGCPQRAWERRDHHASGEQDGPQRPQVGKDLPSRAPREAQLLNPPICSCLWSARRDQASVNRGGGGQGQAGEHPLHRDLGQGERRPAGPSSLYLTGGRGPVGETGWTFRLMAMTRLVGCLSGWLFRPGTTSSRSSGSWPRPCQATSRPRARATPT